MGAVALWALLLVILWLLRPRGVAAREIIRVVPDVVRLLRALIVDRAVPTGVRVVIGGLFVWIISPSI